jgi:hypothetical protein
MLSFSSKIILNILFILSVTVVPGIYQKLQQILKHVDFNLKHKLDSALFLVLYGMDVKTFSRSVTLTFCTF